MKHFRIIDANGAAVYEYSYDLPLAFPEWPAPEFTHVEVTVETPVPVYEGSWRITKLAFRNRFAQAEKVAIEIAALDNPLDTMQRRAQSAALRSSQQDVAVAMFIDLKRQDTRAGVQALETAGLLGVGRAAQILDTPPTDEELFK